ncbi:MAG: hypothetical protein QNL04_05125 [SAR324 cluster bacterium]|nr:hypothetical protein [SAR324 cluster bacterium]
MKALIPKVKSIAFKKAPAKNSKINKAKVLEHLEGWPAINIVKAAHRRLALAKTLHFDVSNLNNANLAKPGIDACSGLTTSPFQNYMTIVEGKGLSFETKPDYLIDAEKVVLPTRFV